MVAPYTVMHIKEGVIKKESSSSDKREVGMIIRVIEVLRGMVGEKPSIGVITFFTKQKQLISLEVQTKKLNNIMVNTVEGFKGNERDIIIVYCGGSSSWGSELLQGRNMMNIALTRAKYNMVIVGNMEILQSSQMWRELVSDAKERNVYYIIDKEKETEMLKEALCVSNLSSS